MICIFKILEYFVEYREKGDGLVLFLGVSIVVKVIIFVVFYIVC